MFFIDKWHNYPMNDEGRKNLDKSDIEWEKAFENISNNPNKFSDCVNKSKLLFRVHKGGYPEPKINPYDPIEYIEQLHRYWEKSKNINEIVFDNHWVSFTKNVNVIGSNYFEGKKLRGYVIVIKPKKSIDISSFFSNYGFQEDEVVAPLDKNTLVEILPFKYFMDKYGTGFSDYEKNCSN